MLRLTVILLSVAAQTIPALAQRSGFLVFEDKAGRVHISKDGQEHVVAGEPDQVSIGSEQTAGDGQTVGWIVYYSDPDNSSPYGGKLVIFRDGHIVRRFGTDQVFWSWSFFAQGKQVAYHVGPRHGEKSSHCELHDVRTGRLLAQWNGDLDGPKRPAWAKGLNH